MNRRHRLGQHYLVDGTVAEKMLELAAVRSGEKVLEIGTGTGALTRRLAGVSGITVEGYEVDPRSFAALAEELGGIPSVRLRNSDAFESSPEFDVLVSSLPYSESSEFVDWVSRRRYGRAVLLLQEDFAVKMVAYPGQDAYRAVSVIAQASADISVVMRVGRRSFSPPPRVNSSLVLMRWKRTLQEREVALIKAIFSQKRKRVGTALKALKLQPHGMGEAESDVRVSMMGPEAVLRLVGTLSAHPTAGLEEGEGEEGGEGRRKP